MPSGVYKHKSPSEETIRKRSLALKGRMPKNIDSIKGWNRGIPQTPEAKKNQSEKMKKIAKERGFGKWMSTKMGESSNNWKGGVTRDRHGNTENKLWRSRVFERDNWTCQTCHARGVYLEAHHIKSWARYPELRYELSNGVTLCRDCHALTDNYKGKKTNEA